MLRFKPSVAVLALALAAGCASTSNPPKSEQPTMVVYLQHVKSADLVSTLEAMHTPDSIKIVGDPASNSVLLEGDSKTVEQALNLIATLDKPTR